MRFRKYLSALILLAFILSCKSAAPPVIPETKPERAESLIPPDSAIESVFDEGEPVFIPEIPPEIPIEEEPEPLVPVEEFPETEELPEAEEFPEPEEFHEPEPLYIPEELPPEIPVEEEQASDLVPEESEEPPFTPVEPEIIEETPPEEEESTFQDEPPETPVESPDALVQVESPPEAPMESELSEEISEEISVEISEEITTEIFEEAPVEIAVETPVEIPETQVSEEVLPWRGPFREPPFPPPFLGPAELPAEPRSDAAPAPRVSPPAPEPRTESSPPPSRQQTPEPEEPIRVPAVPEAPPPSSQQTPAPEEPARVPAEPALESMPAEQLPPESPPEIPREESNLFLPGISEFPAEEQIVFSRTVRLLVGQTLEIPFRGTGWVYLGELSSRRGISYDSRRLDVERGVTVGQSFIFRAEIAGTYILKFYRQDFIQDYIVNDYVQVIVGEEQEQPRTGRPDFYVERGRVVAEPRWPPATGAAAPAAGETGSPSEQSTPSDTIPPSWVAPDTTPTTVAPPATTPSPTSPAETAPVPTPERLDDLAVPRDAPVEIAPPLVSPIAPIIPSQTDDAGLPGDTRPGTLLPQIEPPALPAEEYVRQAKQEYDAGRVGQALIILNQIKQHSLTETDETLWLYGQLYEANSPSRDIKLAIEYYRRLINEFPQSNHAGEARRRIAYLERFYINIR